jgi:hypothetical protein
MMYRRSTCTGLRSGLSISPCECFLLGSDENSWLITHVLRADSEAMSMSSDSSVFEHEMPGG